MFEKLIKVGSGLLLAATVSVPISVSVPTTVLAEGDAAAGEAVFRRCKACHQVGEGAKNRVGPILTGIIGKTAGSTEGYKYGTGLVALNGAGHVWDETNVKEYIVNPRDYVREILDDKSLKAKMAAQRLKPQQLDDVVAYLKTFPAPAAE